MFQMGLRSQPDEQPLSDYSDDLKETIVQTNSLNEVDDIIIGRTDVFRVHIQT
jgi:hypothetical protein